jgi:hypothetical protein
VRLLPAGEVAHSPPACGEGTMATVGLSFPQPVPQAEGEV